MKDTPNEIDEVSKLVSSMLSLDDVPESAWVANIRTVASAKWDTDVMKDLELSEIPGQLQVCYVGKKRALQIAAGHSFYVAQLMMVARDGIRTAKVSPDTLTVAIHIG